MNSHVFDSVFRTLAQKTPYLFVELINEAFGTEYTRKSKLEQLRNEFYEKAPEAPQRKNGDPQRGGPKLGG